MSMSWCSPERSLGPTRILRIADKYSQNEGGGRELNLCQAKINRHLRKLGRPCRWRIKQWRLHAIHCESDKRCTKCILYPKMRLGIILGKSVGQKMHLLHCLSTPVMGLLAGDQAILTRRDADGPLGRDKTAAFSPSQGHK